MEKEETVKAWALFNKGGLVEDGMMADTPAFCIYPLEKFAKKELQESEYVRPVTIILEKK